MVPGKNLKCGIFTVETETDSQHQEIGVEISGGYNPHVKKYPVTWLFSKSTFDKKPSDRLFR